MRTTRGTKARAVIPPLTDLLCALERINADLVAAIHARNPVDHATLDMDATLIETQKKDALFSYKGYKAYQPLNTYWAELGLVLHTEFRDGNVPAGHEQLRVFLHTLSLLPPGVKTVRPAPSMSFCPIATGARRGSCMNDSAGLNSP
jgi:hypothetical protein